MTILDFLPLFFLVPLGAWMAFILVQYRSGDRPVDKRWLHAMLSIGLFENAKAAIASSNIDIQVNVSILIAVVVMFAFSGGGLIATLTDDRP